MTGIIAMLLMPFAVYMAYRAIELEITITSRQKHAPRRTNSP